MDFIERWLHLSPEGGDGKAELSYILALAVVIVLVAARLAPGEVDKAAA